jgi:hypothetical protein
LFEAVAGSQGYGVYSTDKSGSPPKFLTKETVQYPIVSSDGLSTIVVHDGKPALLKFGDSVPKAIPGVSETDFVIAWTVDPKHVYTETPIAATLRIDKLDLDSGKRELWQLWKPKDAVGLVPRTTPIAITPDGSRMVFTQHKTLSTLYKTDTLK